MADDILPTQPLPPSRPVAPPPEQRRREQPKQEQQKEQDDVEQNHRADKDKPGKKGIIDEYV